MKYDASVGIFMPAYNQGQYVHEAIQSLQAQTYQDFIVHIVDDGSNDGYTSEVLADIRYGKAKVFLNRTNKGVVYRANQHFKLLNTKYILILCADDKLEPTFLEKTVDFLEKNPTYGAVSVNIVEYNDNFEGEPCYYFNYDKNRMKFPAMLSECHCLGSSLIRRQALLETDLSGGFKRYQDWDRWISMIEAGWKLGLVPEPLFLYRQHADSLSHSTNANIEKETFLKIINKHADSYKKYSQDVIIDLYSRYWEVVDGKNWLEGQYHNLTAEVENLKKQRKDIRRTGLLTKIRDKLIRTIKK